MSFLLALGAVLLLQTPAQTGPLPLAAGQESPAVAAGTPAAPEQEPVTVDDVTVEARPLDEFVRDFVAETGAPARGRGLARWQGRICVGVVNLESGLAQAIADRVSQVGLGLGLDVAEPGCRANIFIVFTADSDGLTAQLVETYPDAFHVGVGGIDRGRTALAAFTTSDQPVRWWHRSLPVVIDTGAPAIRLPGESDPPMIAVFAASRLTTPIRDDLKRAMVIVDVDRLGQVNLAQLADYLAFVSLVQVDPDAELGAYDTVLNLFHDPAGVDGLTEWDESYLLALYKVQDAPVLRANHAAQAGVVASVMTRDQRRAAAARPEAK